MAAQVLTATGTIGDKKDKKDKKTEEQT